MLDNLFNPNDFVLGGVTLIAMVIGITSFLKEQFSLEGKAVRWLAFGVAAVVMVMFQLIEFIPAPYEDIVRIIFVTVSFALSAIGLYDTTKDMVDRANGVG